jgi:hypothetical protein
MLVVVTCAADNDVCSRGAKQAQIDVLPQRTLTVAAGSNCCICLCAMAVGDVVRTLPCSHFMHRDCIDEWLKVNKGLSFVYTYSMLF